jgi:hypothetical protein
MNIDFCLKIFSFTRRITIHKTWLQYSVMTLAIGISVAAAYWGSVKILLLLVAMLGVVAAFFVTSQYRGLGVIFILLGGMFVPFSGPGGLNASILAVIFLMAVWIMDMFIVKRKFQFIRSRTLRPAFYFIIVSILAFGMGQIPWFVFANQAPLDAQIGGFAIYFFLLATMIMTANLLQDTIWLKTIVWMFVGFGTIYVLGRALHISIIHRLYQRGFHANSMFWLWIITLPLGQAIFNKHLTLRVRILMYGIVALAFYVNFVQQMGWKSGWVPPLIAAATLFGLRFRKLVLLLIPFALIVAVYLVNELISTDLYSWGTRVDAWLIVLEISKVSPLIGLGFANYYWYAPLFPIRGYAIRFNSHSQFVDIIAQTGILGLFSFFWLLFEVGRLGWNLIHSLPDGFAKGYAHAVFAGVLGSVMAAFLVDWLLPFAYNIGLDGVRASILPWIFFGGLISIEQIYSDQRTSSAAP